MPCVEAISKTLLLLAGLAAAACGGSSKAGPVAPTVADQVDLGEGLFRRRCAPCHGLEGRGGRAPNVIGEGALTVQPPPGAKTRKEAFPTAAELLVWTQKKMPPGAAESLKPAEHAAVVAYMLQESGIVVGPRPLDAETAKLIKLR